MKAMSMIIAAGAAALAAVASGETYTWVKSDWIWSAYGFGGTLPGTEDTAVFDDGVSTFKSDFEAGKKTRIFIQQNGTEVDKIVFNTLYGFQLYAGSPVPLTLNSIEARDMNPESGASPAVATNLVEIAGGVRLKGDSPTLYVGGNHVLEIKSVLREVVDGTDVVKTGSGTLISSGADWWMTGSTWVKEGVLIRMGVGTPTIKGNLIVGGAGHEAIVEFGAGTAGMKVPQNGNLEVREGGCVIIDSGDAEYIEYLSVDHGSIVGNGHSFLIYDQSSTERRPMFSLTAGVLDSVTVVLMSGNADFSINEADAPSVIKGTFKQNVDKIINVADGSAVVDFVLDGEWGGGNRQYGKDGPGTMLFINRNSSDLNGLGRDFKIDGGTFILQSETEVGLGTNNIVVASGATLGGTGSQVGGIDPDNANRGLRGNITLNGESDNPATLAPGTVNYETGAFIPGTFAIGSAAQTNNVTFAGKSVLRIGATTSGVSGLVVNGTFTLSGNDELAIVGPADPRQILPGTYEIVKTKEPMTADFASVTYNGGALPSNLKVRKVSSTLITLRAAPKGLSIVLR